MSSYEIEVKGGKETVTIKNADGSIQSVKERNMAPEAWKNEAYAMLHTGTCSICFCKDRPVNPYNVCKDCDTPETDYSGARIPLTSLFKGLNEDAVYQYTSQILKAKTAEDMEKYAREFVEFCLSHGIAGRAYIEDFIPRMTKQTKYNTAMEKTYRTAFAWWLREQKRGVK